MRMRIFAYGLVAVALMIAIVRISDAFIDVQEHEMAHPAHSVPFQVPPKLAKPDTPPPPNDPESGGCLPTEPCWGHQIIRI